MNIYSSISWVDIVSILVLPIILPALVGRIANVTTWSELAKRLTLGALSLVGVILTNLVDAAAGTPVDIGMVVLQFVATWVGGEVAYKKILKARLDPPLIDATENNVVTTVTGAMQSDVQGSYEGFTVKDLQGFLQVRQIDYPKGALKADLIGILEEDDKVTPVLAARVLPPSRTIASLIQRK